MWRTNPDVAADEVDQGVDPDQEAAGQGRAAGPGQGHAVGEAAVTVVVAAGVVDGVAAGANTASPGQGQSLSPASPSPAPSLGPNLPWKTAHQNKRIPD